MSSTKQENIPKFLDNEFFRRTLETGLRLKGVRVLNFRLKDLTLGGENYCSNIYGANVTYQCIDSSTEETEEKQSSEQALIVKYMPRQSQAALNRLNIYLKETIFYLDIKPKLEALMWHTNEPWMLAAKHFVSVADPEETIVFEDLCKQGFELKSRQQGLDEAHAMLVMKKLGQYHALTMAMAMKERTCITERFPFGLLNGDSISSDSFKMLFGAQLLKLASLLSECAGFTEIAKKLLKYHEHFAERVLNAVLPLRGEINVLNHGDLWVNNLLFGYDQSGSVREVRFIDFQLCYYGSPGFDINYFLNTSVQLEVLRDQRHALVERYYDELLHTLHTLPFEVTAPKYEQILHEVQQHEPYGFFVAFGFFPLMSMRGEDSQDNSLDKFNDEEFAHRKIELMFKSNSRTLDTLKYALKRLDDLGVLD